MTAMPDKECHLQLPKLKFTCSLSVGDALLRMLVGVAGIAIASLLLNTSSCPACTYACAEQLHHT